MVLIFFQFVIQPVLAEEQVIFDFFYESGCNSCEENLVLFQPLEQDEKYKDVVVFNWKDKATNESAKQEYETVYHPIFQEIPSFPLSFIVIKNATNRTIITPPDMTMEYVTSVLDEYVAGVEIEKSEDTPSFELIFVIAAVALMLLWKRKQQR
jgi:hypothetical protein